MAEVVVSIQTVVPRKLAAVRRRVVIGAVVTAWKPALDVVWELLRAQPGLRTDGHNIFLYHHGAGPNALMDVDFGVEVSRSFEPVGDVYSTETPGGEVAMAVHRGPYGRLAETHQAIHAWCAAQRRLMAGKSWEIYGDWASDESELETTVVYLLG